jgi:hypothetical protein
MLEPAIPTEPIGSIPRPQNLIDAMSKWNRGEITREALDAIAYAATSDIIRRFEATGSPVISDGEQSKPSFVTYSVHGAANIEPDGIVIPFEDGHTRQLPQLTAGPFRYMTYAADYLSAAKTQTRLPVKQAVISASALSLIYPEGGIPGYSRQQFTEDLVTEAAEDIRRCLQGGAAAVQIDFTEGRLALNWTHRATCSSNSSASTTGYSPVSPARRNRGSACTPVRAAIGMPRTALPSITQSSFHTCSNWTSQTSICRWRASRIVHAFSRWFKICFARTNGCLWALSIRSMRKWKPRRRRVPVSSKLPSSSRLLSLAPRTTADLLLSSTTPQPQGTWRLQRSPRAFRAQCSPQAG